MFYTKFGKKESYQKKKNPIEKKEKTEPAFPFDELFFYELFF